MKRAAFLGGLLAGCSLLFPSLAGVAPCDGDGFLRCEETTAVFCLRNVEISVQCKQNFCDEGFGCAECGDALLSASEGCDDGNLTNGDSCEADCSPSFCGNGIRDLGEVCDDGNLQNDDGCDSNCTPTECGNSIINSDEECDDGDSDNSDDCLSSCVLAICGDGTLQAGVEECDDGNNAPLDGCHADCTLPVCNDALREPGDLCFSLSAQANVGFGQLVAVDHDGDGVQELFGSVVFDGPTPDSTQLKLLATTGAPLSLLATFTSSEGFPSIFSVLSGDINLDSKEDVVFIKNSELDFLAFSLMGPISQNEVATSIMIGGIPPGRPDLFYPLLSDAEGDGDKDLFVSSTLFFRNDGLGFTQQSPVPFFFSLPEAPFLDRQVASLDDFDHNGTLDLVTSALNDPNIGPRLSLFIVNIVNNEFSVTTEIVISLGSFKSVITGDFDGDQDIDIAAIEESEGLICFINDGSNSFSLQPTGNLQIDSSDAFFAAEDLDGLPGDELLLLGFASTFFTIVTKPGTPAEATLQVQTPSGNIGVILGHFGGAGPFDLATLSLVGDVGLYLSTP